LTLVACRWVGCKRHVAARRCTESAACSALLIRAGCCSRVAFRAYPLGYQRQVRTLRFESAYLTLVAILMNTICPRVYPWRYAVANVKYALSTFLQDRRTYCDVSRAANVTFHVVPSVNPAHLM